MLCLDLCLRGSVAVSGHTHTYVLLLACVLVICGQSASQLLLFIPFQHYRCVDSFSLESSSQRCFNKSLVFGTAQYPSSRKASASVKCHRSARAEGVGESEIPFLSVHPNQRPRGLSFYPTEIALGE